MLIPGAKIDAVGIIVNKNVTGLIGKGRNPIHFNNERAIVVFAEQGITPAKRDESLIPVGAGILQAGEELNPGQGYSASALSQIRGEDSKPRKIGHVFITLDISDSMSEACGGNNQVPKLEHV